MTGFLAMIVMRVLKSDYARYARADDEEDDQVCNVVVVVVVVCRVFARRTVIFSRCSFVFNE